MPTAAADAGPLIHLAQINKLPLLKQLFSDIYITQKVKKETIDNGLALGYKDAEAISKALTEGWLKTKPLPKKHSQTAKKLAQGENISQADAETLLLATTEKAELLTDDKILAHLAKMHGLKTWNTWTLLLEALSRDYVKLNDIEQAINELGKKKFRLKPTQAQEILDAAKLINKQKQTSLN